MNRRIILIRHAMPDIPLGERWCVGGRCDLPLGRLGRIQAARLPFVPELKEIKTVFCSPLIRAIETARPLSVEATQMPGLEEQDMGVWDGLPFSEIMERWPELYAARERDAALLPEGAETVEALKARMEKTVLRCLRQSDGDIALVSHKSAIATLTGHRSALGYTSLSVLQEQDGILLVDAVGVAPHPEPEDALCLAMLRAAGADETLLAHCQAVADCADALVMALNEHGCGLDPLLVHRGALLHDLAKGERDHAAVGGTWLRELGYPELAEIVRQHTEPDSDTLNEAGLVFLADKLVRGDRRVRLEERFSSSLGRCTTPEARSAHARRLALARTLKKDIHRLCGAALID